MPPGSPRPASFATIVMVAAATAVAFRFWTSGCFFPLAEWNNVRLAPTFMLAHGMTPYPAGDSGPVTTWIYGPVTLLLNLPAVLAPSSTSALLVAAGMTMLLAVFPALVAVQAASSGNSGSDRYTALFLCLALWPNTSLQYIQSDNTALACGLLSNAFLARSRPGCRRPLALAAVCTALAIWSKQTAISLLAAQVLWLGLSVGPRMAVRHLLYCAVACGALAVLFTAWFGFDGLWLNLVVVPAGLPFVAEPMAHTRGMGVQLFLCVALPSAGLLVGRRAVWRRDSPWLLPALSWLALLPLGLISLYRIGGAPNSLNGVLYLAPLVAVSTVSRLRRMGSGGATWGAFAALAVAIQQLASAPLLPLAPLGSYLAQGEALARANAGRIYFPWHPLVTFYAEHRFDHAEDGLSTRRIAGRPIALPAVRKHLPLDWSMTALPGWRESDPSVSRLLQPADARLVILGRWSVFLWTNSRQDAPVRTTGG